MASLIARSPAEDLLPISHGPLTLTEHVPEAITSLMALNGAGLELPKPNRSGKLGDGVVLWSGRNQGLLLGTPPPELPAIATTDQSDAWAVLRLEGDGAAQVLARLSPLDLNPAMFKRGHTARSLLGHMNALFHRRGTESFEILVFRSMTQSAVHELTRAMRGVVARADT